MCSLRMKHKIQSIELDNLTPPTTWGHMHRLAVRADPQVTPPCLSGQESRRPLFLKNLKFQRIKLKRIKFARLHVMYMKRERFA